MRDLDRQIDQAHRAYVAALQAEVDATRTRITARDALYELRMDRFLAGQRALSADGRKPSAAELLQLGVPCRDCARVLDADDGRHELNVGGRGGWFLTCGRQAIARGMG